METTISSSPTLPDRKMYTCPECPREFRRKEHMHRHHLLHTTTPRPYACPECSRSFTRLDALQRHRTLHNATEPLLTEQILSNPRRRAAVFRSRQACARCSTLKLKCDGNDPCQRCSSKSKGTCHYSHPKRDDTRTRSSSSFDLSDSFIGNTSSAQDLSGNISLGERSSERETSTTIDRESLEQMGAGTMTYSRADRLEEPSTTLQRHVMILDPALEQVNREDHMLEDLETTLSALQQTSTSPNDILPGSDFDWLFTAQTPQALGEQPQDSWAWSFFIDSNNQLISNTAETRTSRRSSALPSAPLEEARPTDTPLDLLSAAAVDSAERALAPVERGTVDGYSAPVQGSARSLMEPRDLRAPSRRNSLPGGGTDGKDWPNSWYPSLADMEMKAEFFENASDEVLMAENSFQVEEFDEVAKSRLLSICQPAELPDNEAKQVFDMLSGVSAATYNILIQLFFERFQPTHPFVHRTTFLPSKVNPLLLGAACAMGTFYTRTPKARNLGNVLIDLVHRAIILTTTRNNVHARSLSNIQALVLICIYFGNAGHRRFLEHAEACRGALITMVRRCRLLDNADEQTFSAQKGREGEDEEERWKAWLHSETGRRTGWACFMTDMELSSTWSLPPLFLLGELKATLPCGEDLWEAPNADIWVSIYQTYTPSPSIDSLHEAFGQSRLAADLEHIDLFQSLILAQSLSLMGQSIVEMTQCKVLRFVEPVRREFVSCLTSALAALGKGSNGSTASKSKSATFAVLLQFVVLRIHLSLHDLQALCGRRGASEARRANSRLRTFFSESAPSAHMIAQSCADMLHQVRTHPIHVACLSMTTFYAVVYLYAYSLHFGLQDSAASSATAPRIVVEKVGDLASPHASQRLLSTMAHFFQSQLAKRTWPTCKNLGSILSYMASREASPAG